MFDRSVSQFSSIVMELNRFTPVTSYDVCNGKLQVNGQRCELRGLRRFAMSRAPRKINYASQLELNHGPARHCSVYLQIPLPLPLPQAPTSYGLYARRRSIPSTILVPCHRDLLSSLQLPFLLSFRRPSPCSDGCLRKQRAGRATRIQIPR